MDTWVLRNLFPGPQALSHGRKSVRITEAPPMSEHPFSVDFIM